MAALLVTVPYALKEHPVQLYHPVDGFGVCRRAQSLPHVGAAGRRHGDIRARRQTGDRRADRRDKLAVGSRRPALPTGWSVFERCGRDTPVAVAAALTARPFATSSSEADVFEPAARITASHWTSFSIVIFAEQTLKLTDLVLECAVMVIAAIPLDLRQDFDVNQKTWNKVSHRRNLRVSSTMQIQPRLMKLLIIAASAFAVTGCGQGVTKVVNKNDGKKVIIVNDPQNGHLKAILGDGSASSIDLPRWAVAYPKGAVLLVQDQEPAGFHGRLQSVILHSDDEVFKVKAFYDKTYVDNSVTVDHPMKGNNGSFRKIRTPAGEILIAIGQGDEGGSVITLTLLKN